MQGVLVSFGIKISVSIAILDIKKEGNPLLTNLVLPSHLDTGC